MQRGSVGETGATGVRQEATSRRGDIPLLIVAAVIAAGMLTFTFIISISHFDNRIDRLEEGEPRIKTSSTYIEREPVREHPALLIEPPAFEVPGLDEAIAYWNGLAGYDLLVISPEGHVDFVVGRVPEVCQPYNGCALRGLAGTGPTNDFPSCTITLTENATTMSGVVAHELGHCLGLEHADGGIMVDAQYHPDIDAGLIQQVVQR